MSAWDGVRRQIDGFERAGWEPRTWRGYGGTRERMEWTINMENPGLAPADHTFREVLGGEIGDSGPNLQSGGDGLEVTP